MNIVIKVILICFICLNMLVNMMMLGLKSGPQIAAKTGIPAGLLFRRIWYSVWKSGVLGITEYRQGRPLCRPLYRPRDHRSMTVALRQLHWLPIRQRIQFKVLTLMHGAVHNRTPRYLSDRIVPHAPSRSLRSATKSLVAVPRINLERYGRRSFSCAGPTLWNALPLGLRTQQDPDRFRRDLKTHLFNVASS